MCTYLSISKIIVIHRLAHTTQYQTIQHRGFRKTRNGYEWSTNFTSDDGRWLRIMLLLLLLLKHTRLYRIKIIKKLSRT